MSCELKTLKLFRGFPSKFNSENWLNVSFDSEISITGFGARFELGDIVKTFTNVENGFYVNLSDTETQSLPLGLLNASIILIDLEGNDHPFITDLPVLVSDWVQGDVELDGFNYTINVDIEENNLEIKIQSANPDDTWIQIITDKIAEHNTSTSAHSYIQGLITSEATAREEADETLQSNIDTEEQERTSADETLQDNIDAEEQARISADTTLQNNINSEAQTRSAADTVLTNNLNTEIATRENADNVLSTAISTEATTRANADTALGTRIDNEEDTRQQNDDMLQDNIDTLEGTVNSHIEDTNNPHEVTKAQVGLGNVDNTSDTNKPVSTAQANAIQAVQDNLDDETDAREQADSGLSTRITANTNNFANYRTSANQDTIDAQKVQKNNDITAGTHTKITYDKKGLVTAGSDLTASDIPSLTLSKISDVTATATELNVLDGITATTVELNYTDGVTSNIQTQLNNKQATISDLGTIRSNAQSGKSAADTIANYGNIVTHNVSEFATAAQGALADSALQENDVINSTSSTSTTSPLSANIGKELNDRLNNVEARGRYLSQWNCATGLPATNPTSSPYTYQRGDYFIVGTVASVSGTNYRPSGSSYTTGVASTTVESNSVAVNDTYIYDGTTWILQSNTQKEVSFANLAGQPTDNTNLAAALNAKVTANNAITGATYTKITYDSKGLVTGGANLSATDIPSLTLSKISDVTATASEVNVLDGITATTTELNYVDGVTSAIQTQLDGKVTSNSAITATATKQLVTYDTKGLVTGGSALSSNDVTSALGYTPYNSTNPNGYITSSYHDSSKVDANSAITASTTKKLVTYDSKGLVTGGSALASSDVTTALGYTPYNSTNPNGYITKSVSDLDNYTLTDDLGAMAYADAVTNGDISGTINQDKITNLTTDLGNKANDSAVVHLAGSETITGQKTYTCSLYYKNTNDDTTTNPSSTIQTYPLIIKDKNDSDMGFIVQDHHANGSTYMNLYSSVGSGSDRKLASLAVGVDTSGNQYTYAPTPTQDTTSSTQIDTVGARNTKLANYPTLSGTNSFTGTNTFNQKTFQVNSTFDGSGSMFMAYDSAGKGNVGFLGYNTGSSIVLRFRSYNATTNTSAEFDIWNDNGGTIHAEGSDGVKNSIRGWVVQYVSALPASPVSNVLYVIPS